jgi:putative addiction module component (TIGR02574 family)
MTEETISEELREELDRRLRAYYDDPGSALSWDEVKERLFGSGPNPSIAE